MCIAKLWRKITTDRLLVQLTSYIIKTRTITVSGLEKDNKNFYPYFGQKWENTAIFNGR